MKQADCKGWIRWLPILMVLFSAAIRLDAENVPLNSADAPDVGIPCVTTTEGKTFLTFLV